MERFLSTLIMDRGILLKFKSVWNWPRACRMDIEKDLINALDGIVHKQFPNPHRIGCPGHEPLAKFAAGPNDAQSDSILSHIRQCALCFDELRELRRSYKKVT